MPITYQHQTPEQFAARLRERYAACQGEECARLVTWVLNHLDAGDFTEQTIMDTLGMDAGQWAALKAQGEILRQSYTVVAQARGV